MTTLADDIKALMDLGISLERATELAVVDRNKVPAPGNLCISLSNFYILYIYFGIPHSSALEFRTYASYFPETILFSACDILNLMKCHNLVVN